VQNGNLLSADKAAPQTPQDKTILLVDDEPMVRNVLSRALRREGYGIMDARDGIEALDMLSGGLRSPVHLLITDLDMPRLGGIDLARHVRAANWVQRVIFMTGDLATANVVKERDSALLWKPFSLRVLTATVREMLMQ
jgi:DNA-binding response OmpR family regulator